MFSYTPVYPQFPEYAAQEDTAANARPVTQTIKTDPVTGEQTMTISLLFLRSKHWGNGE